MRNYFALFIAPFLLAGCDRRPPPAHTPPTTYNALRTIVVLHDNAPPTITSEEISQDQFLADRALQEQMMADQQIGVNRQAVSKDNSCAGSSMWMFDNVGNVLGSWPSNHEICFFRNGVSGCADLRSYYRYCILWDGCSPWATPSGNWIASFWAGSDPGYFTYDDGTTLDANPACLGGTQMYGFTAWERQDNAWTLTNLPGATHICFCSPLFP